MILKKVWKIEEYCMYFRFFKLHLGSKRSAGQPKAIYSEVPKKLAAGTHPAANTTRRPMGMAVLCQLIRRTPSCIRAQQTQAAVSPLFVSPHRSARSIAHPFNSNPYRFLDYSRENVFCQEVPEKTLFFVYSSTIFHSKRVFPICTT